MALPLLADLLGPLHMHFAAARRAYRDYLDGGRTFLHARSLRRINASARSLLLARGWMLPDRLQEDAACLISHYDVWMSLWGDHRAALRPGPDDVFAFENRHSYPREAEARLEALYERLRAQEEEPGSPAANAAVPSG